MRRALLLSNAPDRGLALARAWARAGEHVDVVLLDGAVAVAREAHPAASHVVDALAAGVAVSAHDDALRRRGLLGRGLVEGVKTVDLDEIADLVAEGAERAVWL